MVVVNRFIDSLLEAAERAQKALRVKTQAASFRRWNQLGTPQPALLPLGFDYEIQRASNPDIRPDTFRPDPDVPTLAQLAQGFAPVNAVGVQGVIFDALAAAQPVQPIDIQRGITARGAEAARSFGQSFNTPEQAQSLLDIRDVIQPQGVSPQQFIQNPEPFRPALEALNQGGGFLNRLQGIGQGALNIGQAGLNAVAPFAGSVGEGFFNPTTANPILGGIGIAANAARSIPSDPFAPRGDTLLGAGIPTTADIGRGTEFAFRNPLEAAQREVDFVRPATAPAGRIIGESLVQTFPPLKAADVATQGRLSEVAADVGEVVFPELAVLSNLVPVEAPFLAGVKVLFRGRMVARVWLEALQTIARSHVADDALGAGAKTDLANFADEATAALTQTAQGAPTELAPIVRDVTAPAPPRTIGLKETVETVNQGQPVFAAHVRSPNVSIGRVERFDFKRGARKVEVTTPRGQTRTLEIDDTVFTREGETLPVPQAELPATPLRLTEGADVAGRGADPPPARAVDEVTATTTKVEPKPVTEGLSAAAPTKTVQEHVVTSLASIDETLRTKKLPKGYRARLRDSQRKLRTMAENHKGCL